MQTYDFVTSDDGRMGGRKYRVIGKNVTFRQDFAKGFGPGTSDIMIWNGDGRWVRMKFEACRCMFLCHYPSKQSDEQIKVTRRTYENCVASSEFEYTIEFTPIVKNGATAQFHYTTLDDQGRSGGTKYLAIGQDVTFKQDSAPGSGELLVLNGDGRWAKMSFVPCKCFRLCHTPGSTSDQEVHVTRDPRAEAEVVVEFKPLVKTTVYATKDFGGKQGGFNYEVVGVNTQITEDPASGDIVIRNGDGRWARFVFYKHCDCPEVCHHPAGRSDDQVEVEEYERWDKRKPKPKFHFTVKFLPIPAAGSVAQQ